MQNELKEFAKENEAFVKNKDKSVKTLKEKEDEMLKLLNIDKLDNKKIKKALKNLNEDELKKYNELKKDIKDIEKELAKSVIKIYNDDKKIYNTIFNNLKQNKFNKISKENREKLEDLGELLNNDSDMKSLIEKLSKKLDV